MKCVDLAREKKHKGLKAESKMLSEELRQLRWEKKVAAARRPYSAQGMMRTK